MRGAFKALQAKLQEHSTGAGQALSRLALEDSSFKFSVLGGDGAQVRVNCLLMAPEDYPQSAVGLFLEEEDNNSGGQYQELLSELSDRHFGEKATLPDIVTKVG